MSVNVLEQHAQEVVRLQALDGKWETVGMDRLRGIVPEAVAPNSNAWGNDGLSFILRRHPAAAYPDLTAFTPCEVEIAGQLVWTGRVRETPTKEGDDSQIAVQGQGWQYHLDDDVIERKYVHTRLSDWKDHRSLLDSRLTAFRAAPFVNSEDGALRFGWAQGVPLMQYDHVGVTIDLGPNATAMVAVVDVETQNMSPSFVFYVRGHDTEDATDAASYENWWSNTSQGSTTFRCAGTKGRRYVTIFLYRSGASANPTTLDNTAKLKSVKLFSGPAYESGNASILKASTVIGDVAATACPLLSTDQSLIEATAFDLPEYANDGYRSPREHLQAMNAYHGYDLKVDVEKRIVFRPRPAAPLFEVGAWSGAEFEDASANSGEEILNRVVVEGTGPDGAPLRVERSSSWVLPSAPNAPIITNPSFDTNAAGWTTSSGATITRDTSVFDSSPASLRVNTGTALQGNGVLYPTITGVPVVGRRYRVRLKLRRQKANLRIVLILRQTDTGAAESVSRTYRPGDLPVGTWIELECVNEARTTAPLEVIVQPEDDTASWTAGEVQFYVDSFKLEESTGTLIDRRVFTRTRILPVQSALTEDAAEQIGDVFLANHKTTPLKGSLRAQVGGVRRTQTGETVHPSELLRHTGELIRFGHLIDPDTGGQGRDGRIASVNYDAAAEAATVAIDSDRTAFDALLARAGLLTAS